MWQQVDLEAIKLNVKGALVSGPFGSNIGSRFFVKEGVPVIRGNNLTLGKDKFLDSGFVFVTESKARELKNCIALTDDLIFTAAGTLGQIGLIPKNAKFDRYVISNKQIRLRIDSKKCLPLFAYYYLSSASMRAFVASQNKGSSVPLLTLGIIKKIPIHLPPLSVQRRVVAVLSACDDLIQTNRRQIELLERMAGQLYREWFIRFRFPGFDLTKFAKGVPLDWDVGRASRFFDHVKGKSYTAEELSDKAEHMPFITLKSFNRGGGYRADGLKHFSGRYKHSQVVFRHDVVMAVTDMTQDRVVVGRSARVPDLGERGAVISLDVVKLVPKEITASFLYSYLRLSGFGDFIKEFANGTNVLHLKPDLVTQQVITMPPAELREKFSAIVEPIFDQIDTLNRANSSLEVSRNLLLPRLISGKLNVANLDIQFPPSMQTPA